MEGREGAPAVRIHMFLRNGQGGLADGGLADTFLSTKRATVASYGTIARRSKAMLRVIPDTPEPEYGLA